MIYLGPTADMGDVAPLSGTVPVSTAVKRAAEELLLIKGLIGELEDRLLAWPQLEMAATSMLELQNIDIVQQSLDALTAFLADMAENCGASEVTLDQSLSLVPLGEMRGRLSRP